MIGDHIFVYLDLVYLIEVVIVDLCTFCTLRRLMGSQMTASSWFIVELSFTIIKRAFKHFDTGKKQNELASLVRLAAPFPPYQTCIRNRFMSFYNKKKGKRGHSTVVRFSIRHL